MAENSAESPGGKGSEAALLAAVSSGKSVAAVVGEMVKLDSSKPGELVFSAVKLSPGQAAAIALAALSAGAGVYEVIKAAVSAASGKTLEIVAAAINLMPNKADIIIKAALDAGGGKNDVMNGAIMGRMSVLNPFNGFNPVDAFDLLNGKNKGGGGVFPLDQEVRNASPA